MDQTCPSCCLQEAKLPATAFLGLIFFSCSKLLLIFFFPQLNSKALGVLLHPPKQSPRDEQWEAKYLSGSHQHPSITQAPHPLLGRMLLIHWDVVTKEEGTLGLAQCFKLGCGWVVPSC